MTRWAIELLEEHEDRGGAELAKNVYVRLKGCLGARLLPSGEDLHTVQVFFEDSPEAEFGGALPEGMRRVVVPTTIERLLSFPPIKEETTPEREVQAPPEAVEEETAPECTEPPLHSLSWSYSSLPEAEEVPARLEPPAGAMWYAPAVDPRPRPAPPAGRVEWRDFWWLLIPALFAVALVVRYVYFAMEHDG